jgi:hypothetical protein
MVYKLYTIVGKSTIYVRERDVDLKTAMDRLGLSAAEFAKEHEARTGVSVPPQTIRQARLDPSFDGHRPPPARWREVIAALARERLPEVEELTRLDQDQEVDQ